MGCTKNRDIIWSPISTCADRKSPPDMPPWGRWRDTLNVIVDEDVALRRGGWTRWGAEYADDVADPDLHGYGATTLFSFSQDRGRRVLLAADSSTVRRWVPPGDLETEVEGTWLTIGGPPALEAGERRSISNVGDVVILAGGIGGATAEAIYAYNSRSGTIGAVSNTIGLTSAKTVVSWRGVMFYLDVVMDSVRLGHRIVWSDYNDPASVDPSDDSVAGFQDLDPGEFILGAMPSGDSLFIFTDRSIWRAIATSDADVFRFSQVYRSTTGARCLAAPYSLDILPDGNMIYVGDSGRIFIYSPFAAAPEEPAWLANGMPNILMEPGCHLISGKIVDNGRTLEYLVSYPADVEDDAPTATYAVDFDRLCVSRIDHGFWTFHTYYHVANECPRPTQIILSSAGDDSLKEARFFDVFSRERWVSGTTYAADSYLSEYYSPALGFDVPDRDKRMVRLDVTASTPKGLSSGSIRIYVGSSGYPADPVGTTFEICPILWFTLSSKTVPCAAATSIPVPWRFMVQGRYLYIRISLSGNAVALSKLIANVESLA